MGLALCVLRGGRRRVSFLLGQWYSAEMDSTKPLTAAELQHMLDRKYGRNCRIAVPAFDLKPSLDIPGTCDWFDASLLKFPTALAAARKKYCKECWLVFNKEDDPR